MKRKMIVSMLVITTVLASSFTAFGAEKIDAKDSTACEIVAEEFSFEDFVKGFDDDLSKEDTAKAKTLFDKAEALDKDGKYEEAAKVWDELFNILDIDDGEFIGDADMGEYTFDDFKKELKKDISKADLTKAKTLFDKAVKLDEEGKSKFEEANKLWDELFDMGIFDDEMKYDDKEMMEETDFALDDSEEIYEPTFDDFKKEFKDGVSKEDLAKAKALFDKATKLDKEGEAKFNEASKIWDEIFSMDIFDEAIYEGKDDTMESYEYTFEEFREGLKDDINRQDLEKAKALFDKTMELDKNGKYEEANKLWEDLYKMDIFKEYENASEYTFEDFTKDMKEDMSKEDSAKVKALFEKATKLEKEDKFDEAAKVWDEIFNMNIFDDMEWDYEEE